MQGRENFLSRCSLTGCLILIVVVSLYAQERQSGLRKLSEEEKIRRAAIPEFTVPAEYQIKELPYKVINSAKKHFRPIHDQGQDGSCSQVSGIAYAFTYEINAARGLDGHKPENQYPSYFTYNFLNSGSGTAGSVREDGWDIVKENGIPTLADYGGINQGGPTRWLSGYDYYYRAMHNRLYDYYSIDVSTVEGLHTLKQWMHDHGCGDKVGGVATFSGTSANSWPIMHDSPEEKGKQIILGYNPGTSHSMTFVGYNDSIRYDWSGDGVFTNDQDNNNDGVIDLKDCEIGGLLIANSFGLDWADSGYCWMGYKVCGQKCGEEGGFGGSRVYIVKALKEYSPQLTLKTKVYHRNRELLRVSAGVAADPSATEPEHTKIFPLFNFQGGENRMDCEIGLDITPLLSYIKSGEEARFFLIIDNNYEDYVHNKIESFSIIDYTGQSPEEVLCPETNITMKGNGRTLLMVNKAVDFSGITITDNALPRAEPDKLYSHTLSATGGTPPYNWNVVLPFAEEPLTGDFPDSTVGDSLAPDNKDDGMVLQELGFAFPFFGREYTKVKVSVDGFIFFEDDSAGGISSYKTITVFGSDLYVDGRFPGQGVYCEKGTDYVLFRWSVTYFPYWGTFVDFALKLHANGSIDFLYKKDMYPSLPFKVKISDGTTPSYTGLIGSTSDIQKGHQFRLIPGTFPLGMTLSTDGTFSGTPKEQNRAWEIQFRVEDARRISTVKKLRFTCGDVAIKETVIPAVSNRLDLRHDRGSGKMDVLYTVDRPTSVTLSLYSLQGRKLSTFTTNHHRAGNYQEAFDTKVNSGIYIVTLAVSKTGIVQKQPVVIVR